MKGILASLAAALLASSSPALADERPVVVVFDVETRRIALASDLLDSLGVLETTLLAISGKFRVLARADLRARLTAQKGKPFADRKDHASYWPQGPRMQWGVPAPRCAQCTPAPDTRTS